MEQILTYKIRKNSKLPQAELLRTTNKMHLIVMIYFKFKNLENIKIKILIL